MRREKRKPRLAIGAFHICVDSCATLGAQSARSFIRQSATTSNFNPASFRVHLFPMRLEARPPREARSVTRQGQWPSARTE